MASRIDASNATTFTDGARYGNCFRPQCFYHFRQVWSPVEIALLASPHAESRVGTDDQWSSSFRKEGWRDGAIVGSGGRNVTNQVAGPRTQMASVNESVRRAALLVRSDLIRRIAIERPLLPAFGFCVLFCMRKAAWKFCSHYPCWLNPALDPP